MSKDKGTKIIMHPDLGGNRIKYRMSRFNASKILERFLNNLGWLIVVAAALSLSFYSLMFVSRHYGLPLALSVLVSCAFDGAALVCADLSLKYARNGNDSGLGPKLAVFILAAASAYLNAQHGILNHAPRAAIVLYACPPIVAVMLFELRIRYERRNALRKNGRVAAALPVLGRYTWILFPIKSFKMMRKIVERRLNQHDIEENEQILTQNVVLMAESRQIRAWANSRGINVGNRGRIPGEIVQAFQAEQLAIEAKKESNNPITGHKLSIAESPEDNPEDKAEEMDA